MSAAVTQAQAKQQRSGSNGEEPRVDSDPRQPRRKAQLTTDNDANSANANGVTPLMRAAGDGLGDFVQVLLDRGADVNAKRNDGFTSLALAAFFGHSQVVRLLLERGADAAELTTRSGTSAEMWADVRGFLGIGDLLRETRERKDVQEPAPLPVVLQEHPRFQRPVAEERRQEIGIVQEHEDVDPETPALPDGPPGWGTGTLQTSPVKALPVEGSSDGNSPVKSDCVVSVRPEHRATQTVIQPAPRTAKTLPEIVDPPSVTAPEFHPGLVFVARISSSWKTLAALVIVVLIACGIATFALPQVVRVFTGGHKQAVNNTDLPATSNNPVAQTEQSVSSEIETPTAVPVDGTSAPKAIEETPRDSENIESSRQSEPDGVQYPTSASAAKTAQPESGSYRRSRNRVSRNSGLSVATTLSRASASAKKQETVPAAAKPKQQALDSEPKPAPLSVEVSRSRAVPSTAPSNANEGSGGQSTLVITPSSSKTKVIPWP